MSTLVNSSAVLSSYGYTGYTPNSSFVQHTPYEAVTNAQEFLNLTVPVHLPNMISNNPAASEFLPQTVRTAAPSVDGYTDITPEQSGIDFGGTDYFKYIANDNEVLRKIELIVQLAPLAAGSGGSNPRYEDDILAAAMTKVEFQYGGTNLQPRYGEKMHWDMLRDLNDGELFRVSHERCALMTPQERAARATGTQFVQIEIPFWWTRAPNQAWHQYALQRTTRVVITWDFANNVLQQDGSSVLPTPSGGGNYIVQKWLRFHTTCLTTSTKELFMKNIEAKGDTGKLYLIDDCQRMLKNVATAGTNSTLLSLNTFTGYSHNMVIVIRPTANLNSNPMTNNRWALSDVSAMRLDLSGRTYLSVTSKDELKDIKIGKWKGNSRYPIYCIPFSFDPATWWEGMGGLDFSQINTPQLYIFPPGFSQNWTNDMYIDVYLETRNFVRINIAPGLSGASTVLPLSS